MVMPINTPDEAVLKAHLESESHRASEIKERSVTIIIAENETGPYIRPGSAI